MRCALESIPFVLLRVNTVIPMTIFSCGCEILGSLCAGMIQVTLSNGQVVHVVLIPFEQDEKWSIITQYTSSLKKYTTHLESGIRCHVSLIVILIYYSVREIGVPAGIKLSLGKLISGVGRSYYSTR